MNTQYHGFRRGGLLRLLISIGLTWFAANRGAAADTNRDWQILLQIHYDMMFGADDYFGENRNLGYIDPVRPAPPPLSEVLPIPTPAPGGNAEAAPVSSSGSASNPTPPSSEPPAEPPPQADPGSDPGGGAGGCPS
jgi:hypothetical protein